MSGAISAGTLAAVTGIGAAGSVAGGLINANAAGNAASAQENAANNAANLQYQASQNALNFQKQEYAQTQANQAPWLQAGANGLSNLQYLLGVGGNPQQSQAQSPIPGSPGRVAGGPSLPTAGSQAQSPTQSLTGLGRQLTPLDQPGGNPSTVAMPGSPGLASNSLQQYGTSPSNPTNTMPTATGPQGTVNTNLGGYGSLLTPYQGTFQAPTGLTEQNDPGYQARLQLGTDAIQRSAAARGGVLTGGTAKALDTYGQDYASNEYNNVYNRALTGFQTDYNQYNNDQSNMYNRLAALSGVGQTAANNLSSAGQAASNNVSSNLLNSAANIGQQYNNAGAANASGIVGAANGYGGAISGVGSNLQNLLLLQQLQGGGSGATGGNTNIGLSGWGTSTF